MNKKSVFGVMYPSPSGVGLEEVFFDSEEAASKFIEFRNFKDAEISEYEVFSINEFDLID